MNSPYWRGGIAAKYERIRTRHVSPTHSAITASCQPESMRAFLSFSYISDSIRSDRGGVLRSTGVHLVHVHVHSNTPKSKENREAGKKRKPPPHGPIAHTCLFFFLDGYFSVVFCLIIPSLSSPCWQQLLTSGQWPPVSVACSVFSSCFSPNFPSSAPLQAACAACKSSLPWILQAEKHAQRQPSAPWPNTPAGSALKLKREYRRCLIYFEAAFRCVMRNGTVEP